MYTVRQPKGPFTRFAAFLSLGVSVVLLGAGRAPADIAGTPRTAGVPAPFVAGSGDAAANVARVVARAAGLPLATTYGGTRAHYQGVSARAEAAALDLGVLGVMLTTPMACGRALFTPDQLPERTVADSRDGEASASRDVAGAGPVGAGREEASARPGAAGTASFASTALAVGELVSSADGRSSGHTELVDGVDRRASADVRFGHLDIAGGVVQLRGLRWHAEQRTGAGGTVLAADAAFGLDGVVVAGIPLSTTTPEGSAGSLEAANKVLGPLGLRLEAPVVTRAAGDREVRVSPLKLVIGDATATRPVVGPVMGAALPAREALLEILRNGGDGDCNPGAAGGFALTFVDVVAAALGGSGGIDLELGGVLATTEGIDYGDPLGLVAPGLPTVAPTLSSPVPRSARSVAPVAGPEPPALAAADVAGPAPAPAQVAAPVAVSAASPPVAAVPASRRCESTSRGRTPACSRGAPLAASAGALAVALVLFGTDWFRGRRR
jgi:hypothetical protein